MNKKMMKIFKFWCLRSCRRRMRKPAPRFSVRVELLVLLSCLRRLRRRRELSGMMFAFVSSGVFRSLSSLAVLIHLTKNLRVLLRVISICFRKRHSKVGRRILKAPLSNLLRLTSSRILGESMLDTMSFWITTWPNTKKTSFMKGSIRWLVLRVANSLVVRSRESLLLVL